MKPRHMSYYALESVQSFLLQGTAKIMKAKEKYKKSRKRYISPIRGEAPCKQIFTKFCASEDMLDVTICANFGIEKLRGLRNTWGQILGSLIEMAGHSYNSAALPHSL